MQAEENEWIVSRRKVLTLAGACLVSWDTLYASEFWDKKDPSQWTGEEIDRLTTKSPWAKSVTAQYAPGESGDYGGRSGQGSPNGGGYPRGGGGPMGGPTIGIGGIGFPMPGGRRGGYPRGGGGGRNPGGVGGGGRGGASNYKGTVRWESAQPILDALKNPLPEAFANLYVIGIRDIPLLDDRRRAQDDDDSDSTAASKASKETIDNLKRSALLQPKGRETVEAQVAQQMTPGGTYFLFGFSKAQLDVGKNDHEVDFSTRLGRLIVKARFDLTEMKYHGKLAL
jgi:hypothetical protein